MGLLWPTFLRLLADKVDIRDAGFDICFSGVMGFILFVAITNGMMLYLAIPENSEMSRKLYLLCMIRTKIGSASN